MEGGGPRRVGCVKTLMFLGSKIGTRARTGAGMGKRLEGLTNAVAAELANAPNDCEAATLFFGASTTGQRGCGWVLERGKRQTERERECARWGRTKWVLP